MLLSKCSCGVYYTESKEVQKEIGTCIEKNTSVTVVCKCPICGEKSVLGGEPDFDEFSNEMCVMIFDKDYTEEDKNSPVYPNIILEEYIKKEKNFEKEKNMKKFIIYWKDGSKEISEGVNEKDAFKNAGLSSGAIPAIDFVGSFYDQDKYEFDGETWRNKEILKNEQRV